MSGRADLVAAAMAINAPLPGYFPLVLFAAMGQISELHQELLRVGAWRLTRLIAGNPRPVRVSALVERLLPTAQSVEFVFAGMGYRAELCGFGVGHAFRLVVRERESGLIVCRSRGRHLYRTTPCDGGPFASEAEYIKAKSHEEQRQPAQALLTLAAGQMLRHLASLHIAPIFWGNKSPELQELLESEVEAQCLAKPGGLAVFVAQLEADPLAGLLRLVVREQNGPCCWVAQAQPLDVLDADA